MNNVDGGTVPYPYPMLEIGANIQNLKSVTALQCIMCTMYSFSYIKNREFEKSTKWINKMHAVMSC